MKELEENQLTNVTGGNGGLQNGPSENNLCQDQCLRSKGMNPTQEDVAYCKEQCGHLDTAKFLEELTKKY